MAGGCGRPSSVGLNSAEATLATLRLHVLDDTRLLGGFTQTAAAAALLVAAALFAAAVAALLLAAAALFAAAAGSRTSAITFAFVVTAPDVPDVVIFVGTFLLLPALLLPALLPPAAPAAHAATRGICHVAALTSSLSRQIASRLATIQGFVIVLHLLRLRLLLLLLLLLLLQLNRQSPPSVALHKSAGREQRTDALMPRIQRRMAALRDFSCRGSV